MTIKPIPGADQPLTLDAIRERDRWADQVPAEGGITSAQRAMDRRWLLAELDRLRAIEAVRVDAIGSILAKHAAAVGAVGPMPARAIEASFVAVHSHRVGDASPETAEPCGEPVDVLRGSRFRAEIERHGTAAQHERARYRVAAEEVPSGALLDVVRAVDASRPGLTEEQAREVLDLLDDAIAEQEDGDGTETSNGNARLRIATFRGIKAAILRASRGETSPAPDPRATLHAGDPASLADVVAASAREPHADVVLHALHVSGGAAAIGVESPVRDPRVDYSPDMHCARCDKPVGMTAVREGEDVLCLPCSIDDADGRDLDRSP